MKPLYKVGDKVLIKKCYDKNCNEVDYRYSFTQYMLNTYGGTIQTITNVTQAANKPCKVLDDGYRYRLQNVWNWSSGMFEPEF